MRKFTRSVVTGALAAPLLLTGAAGIAAADSYSDQSSVAGPSGAWSEGVHSGTGEGGHGATFSRSMNGAGPDGAWSKDVDSRTGNGQDHDDHRGNGLFGGLRG